MGATRRTTVAPLPFKSQETKNADVWVDGAIIGVKNLDAAIEMLVTSGLPNLDTLDQAVASVYGTVDAPLPSAATRQPAVAAPGELLAGKGSYWYTEAPVGRG